LLSFILGATETTIRPDVAPDGIVAVIDVSLQEMMINAKPLSIATLPSWEVPNPVPEIVTWLPTDPVVAEIPLMTGGVDEAEVIETLSNVAVASAELVPLAVTRPK
jgi:hypothetical protein